MKVTFKIWRQENRNTKGAIKEYKVDGLTEDMSFLEALDHLNESLVLKNEKVIAYEYDCREGICGQCGVFINGRAHGPHDNITTCQLHMRSFEDGDTIVVEPWRAASFPVLKDLIVDRSAFDRIMEQGGYITAKTGTAPEANAILVPKEVSDSAMDPEAHKRVQEMTYQMELEGFGSCSFTGACEVECPEGISITNIAEMYAKYTKAKLFG